MTAPTFSPPVAAAQPSTADFGPDFTRTKDDPEIKTAIPKVNAKHPPKPGILDSLGTNKKARSGIRALTEEDGRKLANWYRRIGKVVRTFRPALGVALVEQADDCADCWLELAENNDKVRRGILAFVEGGAWGNVIAAHAPIFMAALPEALLEKLFLTGIGSFFMSEEDGETDHSSEYEDN